MGQSMEGAPLDDAIRLSPFFMLPPEIRNIIYAYVLVPNTSSPFLVPRDRRVLDKDEELYICTRCGGVSDRQHSRWDPQDQHCRAKLRCILPTYTAPRVSTSLLRSCRKIRSEASPIFYEGNAFHLNDSSTLCIFRWDTLGTFWTSELLIDLPGVGMAELFTGTWPPGTRVYGLQKDSVFQCLLAGSFPHLKRLTLHFTNTVPHHVAQAAVRILGLEQVHMTFIRCGTRQYLPRYLLLTECTRDQAADQLSQIETVRAYIMRHEPRSQDRSRSPPGLFNITVWRGSLTTAHLPPGITPALLDNAGARFLVRCSVLEL